MMSLISLATVSVVLYKNNFDVISTLISNFLQIEVKKILIIDNSPSDDLKDLINIDSKIEYIHCPTNPGFGVAHNIAIKKSIEYGAEYHFVVNPDIYFFDDVIRSMLTYLKNNSDVGMLMPKLLNQDGTIQYLPKLLPSPFTIILRKIKMPQLYYKKFIDQYELRFVNQSKIYNTPLLSGCFTLLNLKAISEIGMYDEKYFMYFEDWDLSRRMNLKYKTIYFPDVFVYHIYNSGANKNIRLFKIFLKSAVTYFNKWGWIYDKDRKKINKKILNQFK